MVKILTNNVIEQNTSFILLISRRMKYSEVFAKVLTISKNIVIVKLLMRIVDAVHSCSRYK